MSGAWYRVCYFEADALHRLVLVVGNRTVLGTACHRDWIAIAFFDNLWYIVDVHQTLAL